MKTNIATTREQSDRLLRCGVSAESADMMITPHNTLSTEAYKSVLKDRGYFPAFSLSCLLSLLPKEIYDENGDSYYFSIAKEFPLSEEYGAAYIPCWEKGDAIVRKRDNNPIDACVQLIEWLAGDGYNLNGIEKGGEK